MDPKRDWTFCKIETCRNIHELRRVATKWMKVHGPRTDVYVSIPDCAVYLFWEGHSPTVQMNLVPVERWVLNPL
jgi:hypothetical protein